MGEYSTLTDVLPVSSLVDVVFYCGITMQHAVKRKSEKLIELHNVLIPVASPRPLQMLLFVKLLIASLPVPAPCLRLSTTMSRSVPFLIVYHASSLLPLYRANNLFSSVSLWHLKPLPMCQITWRSRRSILLKYVLLIGCILTCTS